MTEQKLKTPEPIQESQELADKKADTTYPHLHLKDWPFQTVPDERFTKIWADRRQVLEVVYSLLNNLSRRKTSTINLIWAWYGTGKSHTLKHMVHLCQQKFKSLLPVYTEYPKTVKSFLDLYVYFIAELGVDFIADVGVEFINSRKSVSNKRALSSISPDFVAALELLEKDELLAKRFLMAEKLHRATLSKHGIGKRIETSDDAVKAVACIVKMLELSGRCSRVVWMIDEFQRIGSERTAVSEDINTGLHSVYNACPNSFSLLFSFSVREKQKMFKHLSKEIIDRIGIQKIIEVPKMSSQDAFIFISDLLYEFRPDPDKVPSTFYPFEDEAVKYIIALIEKTSELKPRSIMQFFNAVLEVADLQIAQGMMKSIDLEFAKKTLTGYDLFLSFQKESMLEKA
jgi:hypothetical protein